MKKQNDTNDIISRIHEYSLEEIMGERFGSYAKEIIQDRAIPDVRDGLKPVQRRIIYAMNKVGNTYNHSYIKCASTVGEVLGKFHPHGDSSVYDAMVRMSQWWKQNHILVDIHGNNGSMDGDGPAAYRYTEARLSKISEELLKDLDKDTVAWAPNFDDRFLEPTVLPAKFPNLLVNGSNGISAGYATNIPPHNLGEVIDATIKRIDSPNCHLDTILNIVKGPDFPTGGIVEGKKGITEAFETGKGRVVVRSKCEFVKEKGKEQIIISEIPFEVNKSSLVNKMDSIRIDKKIDGMLEVRDESDREGLRIVVDLKAGANKEAILNYLFLNTDLQITYSYNMVAIVNRRPMTLGILELLDAYIAHQKEVIVRRSEFDLKTYLKRLHIVDGFLKMLSILDEVIKVIRASKNKGDAKDNLVKSFDFTPEQAEAIVTLQLYKLTNTDVTELEEEKIKLDKFIEALKLILSDENKLKEVMKHELKKIKSEYAVPRKTVIKDEITEIKIDIKETIPKEDVIVVVTNEGYIKRVSKRSYNKDEQTFVKEGDHVSSIYEANTMDTLLIFTTKGNYLYIPVYEIPELKWKELGKHVSNIVNIDEEETVINSMIVSSFEKEQYITIFTKNGNVKRSLLSEFKVQRYSKAINCMNLKNDDEVVSVSYDSKDNVLVITKMGYALKYDISEIPVTGLKTSGVKAISLKNDEVKDGLIINDDDSIVIVTEKNTAKRMHTRDIEKMSRTRKGARIIRDVKTNPYYVISAFVVNSKSLLGLAQGIDITNVKITEIPFCDSLSTGTSISKGKIDSSFIVSTLDNTSQNDAPETITEDDLKTVDDKIMTIGDFLDNFDIDK